jgi:NADH-quinone oxidoreductase subunit L
VLAYSTVSQLGYMFLAMGMGAYGAGIFHLYTHAFFKALLFLGSGAVIHALHGEQDIRNMGGLKKELPITYWTFLVGSLAIAGVPGLAGFFSKDEILFETFAHGHWILWTIGILTSLLTATYMFRLVFLTFHGDRRAGATATHVGAESHPDGAMAHHVGASSHPAGADSHQHDSASHHHGAGSHLHDAPPAMALALIVLAIGSVLAGYIGVPHALGGGNMLGTWLEPVFAGPAVAGEVAGGPGGEVAGGLQASGEAAEGGAESLEMTLMVVSSVIALIGIGLAAFIWLRNRAIAASAARSFAGLHRLLMNKYYVDEIYDATIVHPLVGISREGLWRGFDVRVIDAAVNGAGTLVSGSAWVMRRLQSGSVRTYASSLFIGVVLILGYYLWR